MTKQEDAVAKLRRFGFRVVNRLRPSEEKEVGDVVMVKRMGPVTQQAQVDEDGFVNGQPGVEYLMGIQSSDRSVTARSGEEKHIEDKMWQMGYSPDKYEMISKGGKLAIRFFGETASVVRYLADRLSSSFRVHEQDRMLVFAADRLMTASMETDVPVNQEFEEWLTNTIAGGGDIQSIDRVVFGFHQEPYLRVYYTTVGGSKIRYVLTFGNIRQRQAAAGMPVAAFQAKVRRIMQKIAQRYGGRASGQVVSGTTQDGAMWSATISRHNASNGETFGRLDLTVQGRTEHEPPLTFGEFWDWNKVFEKAGILVVNEGVRFASKSYPASYFLRQAVRPGANAYGLMDTENEDLTAEGLIAKMREWQESEGGVPAFIWVDAVDRLQDFGVKPPSGIHRIASRESVIAQRIVATRIGGMSPEEYAALWGSTKGQGAAHFYNYGSERQVKDARFYFQFMNGPGGIKDTLKMIQNSLVAKDGNFSQKDWDEMNQFARLISDEARRAK